MFYKNSQNYKVQSILSSYSGEPQVIRADSSDRAGGGCRGRLAASFAINTCVWP